ncbi:hypothetical protein MPH_09005 [Macrophomina phaseolina MS6]|uniref:Rhodopsin domain-containing protein n=1 Tax=Macrophomina phaseolina (strain MS6) TaxID=1126212 RepID=K2RGV2_MACPH|nr:hypothetical protein MPH_09005 [Macrophomina phaseolina MS6]
MALIKTSILLFYRRIFLPHTSFSIIIAVLITTIWLWAIATTLTAFLLCHPFPYNWGVGEGTCGNRVANFVVNGAINMLTDASMLVLPLPYIFTLQMGVWKRLGVATWFCLGVL